MALWSSMQDLTARPTLTNYIIADWGGGGGVGTQKKNNKKSAGGGGGREEHTNNSREQNINKTTPLDDGEVRVGLRGKKKKKMSIKTSGAKCMMTR